MPSHYSISVQPTDCAGEPTTTPPLVFTVSNHDDLFSILDRVRGSEVVPAQEAAEFVIGLKLFLEVMIRHRTSPLFQGLWPHMGEFMKALKAMPSRSENADPCA